MTNLTCTKISHKKIAMNSFTWELKFSKPIDLSGEIDDHMTVVIHSISLSSGSNSAQVYLTINGNKFVVANLSARKVTTKVGLILSAEDGDMQFSCSNGASVIVNGEVQVGSCCDGHEHDHTHDHIDEEVSGDEDAAIETESEQEEEIEEDDEDAEDDGEDDEDEDDGGEGVEDEEDEEEHEEEEDEESEEEESEVPTQTKKVTFNPKEQGPHKPSDTVEPLKPAIKQQPPVAQKVNDKIAQQGTSSTPASRVGQTLVLPGGLKYTILKEGRGPVASYGKRVNVRYVGCLASNGKRFDKGQIRFRLGAGEVIEGWDKGVKDMRVGESRRLLIPSQLGYGKRGAPPAIPPNAALAFEVELLDLQ
jgi:FK506-binding nuclear protein